MCEGVGVMDDGNGEKIFLLRTEKQHEETKLLKTLYSSR